jgi:hypothetical protein
VKTTVVVDEAGCMVLPKRIRNAIGVFGRTSVQVEVLEKTARITAPEVSSGPIIQKGKRTVFDGPLPADWDSGDAVLKTRRRRMRS